MAPLRALGEKAVRVEAPGIVPQQAMAVQRVDRHDHDTAVLDPGRAEREAAPRPTGDERRRREEPHRFLEDRTGVGQPLDVFGPHGPAARDALHLGDEPRFLLGVAEGGVWPAILVMLSKWFPAEERGRANALFIMNLNIAILVSSPVSGWIIQTFGWRDLFVIEGVASMLLVFVWWPLIDERPQHAKWISEEERTYITDRIAAEERSVRRAGIDTYRKLLADPNLWLLTAFYFFFQVGDIGFMMWLPTILKSLTNRGMTVVGMLSALPFLAAMAGLYLMASLSDASGRRKIFLAIPGLGFAAAFLLSVQTREIALVSYGFLLICGLFHNAYNGVFWTLPPRLFASEVSGGARGLINGIGNLGGFLGPFLVGWVVTATGSTEYGVYVLSGFLVLAFLISLTLPASAIDDPPKALRRDPTGQTMPS